MLTKKQIEEASKKAGKDQIKYIYEAGKEEGIREVFENVLKSCNQYFPEVDFFDNVKKGEFETYKGITALELIKLAKNKYNIEL